MSRLWLFKEEPTHYCFDDLLEDKRTVWDGVRNNLALQHLRSVAKGDRAFYYHTGNEKAVVGVIQVIQGPYPDPNQNHPRLVVVEVRALRRLERPVTLAEIKASPKLADFALVRLPRLSVMPVSASEWNQIERMAKRPAGSMPGQGGSRTG